MRETIDRIHRKIIYPILVSGAAKTDREIAHERAIRIMERTLVESHALRYLASEFFTCKDPILRTDCLGLIFENPLGLAAGFDKDARVFPGIAALGFGHVEVGSITRIPYPGQPRPRIFTLPEDDSLINRMGFPGKGVDQAEKNLQRNLDHQAFHLKNYHLGVNVSASRPSFDRGTVFEDITFAFRRLYQYADYMTVNASSPNTEGLRSIFQDPENISVLLANLTMIRSAFISKKPIMFKLSPDMDDNLSKETVKVLQERDADGVILANTTIDPEIRSRLVSADASEPGGISGAAIRQKTRDFSQRIFEETAGSLPIIRAGGIFDAKDVWEGATYGGAELFQVYAGFVLRKTSTPNLAYYINRDLARNLRYAGLSSPKELKGRKDLKYPGI